MKVIPAVPLVTLLPLVKLNVAFPKIAEPSPCVRPGPGVARSETRV